ncbi:MAG: aminomethyl-transferring glycine dehydrogenase subunit GcvPA [Chlamydiota bacterium]|nr:aminomethyl-transferring glycine dehydrogenase subunit GcvPA [Chlamydiota bacterium]
MDFTANEEPQILEMLKLIGVDRIEDLFCDIPSEIYMDAPKIDDGLSEFEGIQHMRSLAKKNTAYAMENYLGAGAYEHHVPVLAQAICQKSELLTAYTPYQAEASQGMLQIIFEFQSSICAITNMDVANASLYDGSSACAEAILMTLRQQKGKTKVLVAGSLHPHYRDVIDEYLENHEVTIVTIPIDAEGILDKDFIDKNLDDKTAAVLIQYPNFFGSIDDAHDIFTKSSAAGALNIICANPLAYALYETASELGADIAVGECQPLGIPLQFGGPYAGYIACKEKYVRQMPGRIVGETVDTENKRGFVLTLQAREQHIRREKATSNICTNQALCALSTLITTLWYGPEGLHKLAMTNFQRASYLKKALEEIDGITVYNSKPHFNEFAIRLDQPLDEILPVFRRNGIEPGLALGKYFSEHSQSLLIAVTETKSKEQLDQYIATMKQALGAVPVTKS